MNQANNCVLFQCFKPIPQQIAVIDHIHVILYCKFNKHKIIVRTNGF